MLFFDLFYFANYRLIQKFRFNALDITIKSKTGYIFSRYTLFHLIGIISRLYLVLLFHVKLLQKYVKVACSGFQWPCGAS